MSYTTDPDTRAAFIGHLHALADYLADNPDIPVPELWHEISILLHAHGTDTAKYAEVNRIAGLMNTSVLDETPKGGHCTTTRRFGPLAYTIVAIPDEYHRRYLAGQSYADNVIPDPAPAVTA